MAQKDLNTVTISGRVLKTCTLVNSPGSIPHLHFNLVYNTLQKTSYETKSGQGYKLVPNIIPVSYFGPNVEILAQFLVTNQVISVSGELRQIIWTKDVMNVRTEIIAFSIFFFTKIASYRRNRKKGISSPEDDENVISPLVDSYSLDNLNVVDTKNPPINSLTEALPPEDYKKLLEKKERYLETKNDAINLLKKDMQELLDAEILQPDKPFEKNENINQNENPKNLLDDDSLKRSSLIDSILKKE